MSNFNAGDIISNTKGGITNEWAGTTFEFIKYVDEYEEKALVKLLEIPSGTEKVKNYATFKANNDSEFFVIGDNVVLGVRGFTRVKQNNVSKTFPRVISFDDIKKGDVIRTKYRITDMIVTVEGTVVYRNTDSVSSKQWNTLADNTWHDMTIILLDRKIVLPTEVGTIIDVIPPTGSDLKTDRLILTKDERWFEVGNHVMFTIDSLIKHIKTYDCEVMIIAKGLNV